jgi:hypothetical protein
VSITAFANSTPWSAMGLPEGGTMKRLAAIAFCLTAFLSTAARSDDRSYQGLWWNPGQSGWGVNIVHQGDILFATWFTYDADGNGMWLVLPSAQLDPPSMGGMMDMMDMMGMGGMDESMPTYHGTLYRTTGPSLDATSFDTSKVKTTQVGTAQFQFYDGNHASFTYTVGANTTTVNITRQLFGPMPECSLGGEAAATPNFTDLWWRAGGTESGWGVNLVQQGNNVFATWFTYDANGNGEWLVMPGASNPSAMTWEGTLYRTRGPAFGGAWDASKVGVSVAGTATFAFVDASRGTFSATVDGVSISKPISRMVYGSPTTVCR